MTKVKTTAKPIKGGRGGGGVKRLPRWVAATRPIALKPTAVEEFAPRVKLGRVINALGLSAAADVLGVDKSQLSRCMRGTENISSELMRRVTDVEFVLDRALQVMNPEDVGPWFAAPEPLLGNSIPMNVLTLSGPAKVIAALDGIGAGVFA